jgi:hypothetical protein
VFGVCVVSAGVRTGHWMLLRLSRVFNFEPNFKRLASCNVFFFRPTETLARCHDAAWGGHGRTWLAVLWYNIRAPCPRVIRPHASAQAAVRSAWKVFSSRTRRTVPVPVRGSSLDQATRPRGASHRDPPPSWLSPAHSPGCSRPLPRARIDMAATQDNVAMYRRQRRGDSPSSYRARALRAGAQEVSRD